MMSDRPSDTPSPAVLPYGRTDHRRRRTRLLILASLALSLALTTYLTYSRLANWYARRQGLRTVQAWYQQARTFTLPPATLLYSENPADFRLARPVTAVSPTTSRTYVAFDRQYPALRQIGYITGGVPVAHDFDVLFAHERLAWDTTSPTGSSPHVVTARYFGLDATGRPSFSVMTYKPITGIPIHFSGGSTLTPTPPDRPLIHLRLYAGQPDPADPARFHIPFSCTSGTGRFTFTCDTDPSDGGLLVPPVTLSWDSPSPAATAPAAPPPDASGGARHSIPW